MVDADHLYAADFAWWKYHIADIARDFNGRCWSCDHSGGSNWRDNDPHAWGVTLLECNTTAKGLSTDPEIVHSGDNSGYQAINLALHLGAERIILIGFDMHNHGGKAHWFGNHPKRLATGDKPERFIAKFRTIKPEQYGLEILNCTRVTALDAFTRHDLEDVL